MRKADQSNADRRGDYARDHNAHFIQYCFVSSAYKENLCLNSGLNTRHHGLCRNQHSRNSFQLKENQCSDFKGMDDLLKDLPDANSHWATRAVTAIKYAPYSQDKRLSQVFCDRKNAAHLPGIARRSANLAKDSDRQFIAPQPSFRVMSPDPNTGALVVGRFARAGSYLWRWLSGLINKKKQACAYQGCQG